MKGNKTGLILYTRSEVLSFLHSNPVLKKRGGGAAVVAG